MNTRVKTALDRMAAQQFPSVEAMRDAPPIERARWWRDRPADVTASPTTRVPLRSPVRRRLLLAGGLAAIVGAAVLVLPSLPGGVAYAATPPLLAYEPVAGKTANEVLAELAGRARGQLGPVGAGRFHYVHTRGWYLHTATDDTDRLLRSGIATVDREQWKAVDGSGRLKVSDGTPEAPNATFPPGGLTKGFLADDATVADVQARLNQDTPSGIANAVSELWARQVVPPVLHSKLLTILASQPDLTLLGTTTDRAGRRGVAIGVERRQGIAERRVLVFAPDTGALLDSELIALEASELPVKVPATIAYTVWLGTGYTATTEQRPAG